MMKFDVDLWARARYTIEADTKDEAIEQALEHWENLIPDIFCEEIKEEKSCSKCDHFIEETDMDVACCNCCENYCFFSLDDNRTENFEEVS
jgi:hypothetical protein